MIDPTSSAPSIRSLEDLSASLLKIIGQNGENLSTQMGDQILSLSTEIHQKIQNLRNEISESTLKIISDNNASFSKMLGERLLEFSIELDRREQASIEALLKRSAAITPPSKQTTRAAPIPVRDQLSLEQAKERLRKLAPLNFDTYLDCLNTGTASYEGLPAESCSTERHPQALLFRDFLKPFLTGHVLDIGCGPQPVPSYLSEWPVEQITGIDPISNAKDHPFQFVSGVGEFIPFQDGSFGTVISGTTLDHYYLLDRGLEEAYRVLEPGGHFVAWITEFSGAPSYDPYSARVASYDTEHMYHIDRSWFLPMMERVGFREVEVLCLPQPFRYLFMSFRKPGPRHQQRPSFAKQLNQLFMSRR